jgi:tight adherence protein C
VVVILFAGLALMGLSVALVARAVMIPRFRTAETLGQIESYGFSVRAADDGSRPPLRGVLDSVAGLIGAMIARRFGTVREAELRKELMSAGLYKIAPRKFMGYRLLAAFTLPGIWLWYSAAAGPGGLMTVLGCFGAVVGGWVAPVTLVRRKARRRFAQIDYDLPELIDLLVVTVEAGLGFSGALQTASTRFEGPLGDELRLALQEQSMGLSTHEALRNMLTRCETPVMRAFVRSVLQGETLGVSIGQILRELATDMRKRRRAAAEERAQKAPVKLLFPLVFLIFPAMFVVLLGPALFSFIKAFGGG